MKPDWSKAPEWATLYTAEWRGSDRVDCAIFEERPADPYAALKAAAKDPTKQIRMRDRYGYYCQWHNAGIQPAWAFIYPVEDYQIRDKPVVKTAYRRLWRDQSGEIRYVIRDSPHGVLEGGPIAQWIGPTEEFTYEEPQP